MNLLGWLASLLFAVSSIPQIVKVLKTRSAKDLSVLGYILPALGNLSGAIYAFHIQNPVLAGGYALGTSNNLILIILCLLYGKRS